MSDDTRIRRIGISELESYAQQLQNTGHHAEANDALVLQHLIASLRANAERDLLMAQMAARFDELEKSFADEKALHSVVYRALVDEFAALKKQQQELHARQDMIVAVIDAGIERISEVAARSEALVRDLEENCGP